MPRSEHRLLCMVTVRAVCLIWAAADGSLKTARDWHYQQSEGITCSFCAAEISQVTHDSSAAHAGIAWSPEP